MSFRLTLPGSIRSKKNSKQAVIVGGVHAPKRAVLLPSKAYSKWEKECHAHMLRELRGPKPVFPGDAALHVTAICYFKGPEPDLSGCLESVGDCLEGWVFLDDRQIKSWDGSRTFHDKNNPRTEVWVELFS